MAHVRVTVSIKYVDALSPRLMRDVCGRELMGNLRPTRNAEKDGPLKLYRLSAAIAHSASIDYEYRYQHYPQNY